MARKKTKYKNPFLRVKQNEISVADSLIQSINQGIALHQQGLLSEAQEIYCQILKIDNQNPDALHLLGVIDYQTGKFQDAVQKISQAISINPVVALYYSNLGNALQELKQFEASLKCYEKAISINPNCLEAFSNRGVALQELSRWSEAVSSFDTAIDIKPDYAEAYSNKGVSLQKLRKIQEALSCYNKAIEVNPNYAEAYSNRGSALKELKDWLSAVKSYDKALELKPSFPYLFGMRLHAKMKICDWTNFDSEVQALRHQIQKNLRASVSFPVLSMPTSLNDQRKVSEIWVADKYPENNSLGPLAKSSRKNKIRIGYFSADFHNHATTYLMAELLERHDKNKFELIGFSFGPKQLDQMRIRISRAFDKFIDVSDMSDMAIAKLSRELDVDIAVDLKGLTHDARLGIFSYRAAPIQVNYLGYPGTTGANYIDYLIADKTLIPTESQEFYSEKIVYLPNTYQVNDRQRLISDINFARSEMGLPEKGFVFCSFNNNFKITPAIFDSWARILKAVDGSVLWLFEDNPIAAQNLRQSAQILGIDPNRLVFAKHMELPHHLARHKLADLFLDTLPYNAHTTASDALWVGLPVLTCMGESFASRVAASLLYSIELPELVTTTLESYEKLAIDLALTPTKLSSIKEKLFAKRLTAPLFNSELFTEGLESAYIRLYERFQDNLPRDHLFI
jgi:predicted O-linked N-acetylglucosamine transferase (SPINDLY family)